MKKKLSLVICLFLINALNVFAAYQPVKDLAQRRVPWLASSLVFDSITTENGKDVFILQTKNNKLIIKASGENAAAKALGYYLKYYCDRSMSHMGDNLSVVVGLPKISEPVKIVSSADIRFGFNYVTINYTMGFYQWKDWERELDWMALNGVTLVITPIGVEAVWQNTLKKLGCTDKEILEFIAGPAFNSWWLMGNLEGWGGTSNPRYDRSAGGFAKKHFEKNACFRNSTSSAWFLWNGTNNA